MTPSAPGRLSMTKRCPSLDSIPGASDRKIASATLPAAKGTMSRTGFAGHSWAWTERLAQAAMMRAKPQIRRIESLLVGVPLEYKADSLSGSSAGGGGACASPCDDG